MDEPDIENIGGCDVYAAPLLGWLSSESLIDLMKDA